MRSHVGGWLTAMRSLLPLLLGAALGAAAASVTTPGCYGDDTGVGHRHRLMPFTGIKNMGPSVDIDTCDAACSARNFSLAGVEAGHGCFCAHELAAPIGPLVPDIECCTPCIGNASQTCGVRTQAPPPPVPRRL